jgi:hypothetical protein
MMDGALRGVSRQAKIVIGKTRIGWMEYLKEIKLGEVLGFLAAPTPTHNVKEE